MYTKHVIVCGLGNIMFFILLGSTILFATSCAVDMPLIGGAKDTIPPVLIAQTFYDSSINFKQNKIGFLFDENVDVKEANKIVVNPFSADNKPEVRFNLKKMWMFWEKPLDSNVTYTIDFENSLTDLHEGNVYKPFLVVFSTGNHIDSISYLGKILEAKTGQPDSTITALLFKDLDDSAVIKNSPRYIARVNNKGIFEFRNLVPGKYRLYAIADPSGMYRYLNPTQPFAFLDSIIDIQHSGGLDTIENILYAFSIPKESKDNKKRIRKNDTLVITKPTKKINILDTGITLIFNKPIREIDTSCIFFFLDSGKYIIKDYKYIFDTTLTQLTFLYDKWQMDTSYRIIIEQGAILDTFLRRNIVADTISLLSHQKKEYSNLKIHIEKSQDSLTNRVLFILENDKIVRKLAIDKKEFFLDTMLVGDYSIQILYDDNHNMQWDNGEYLPAKRQPEKTILLPDKRSIKFHQPDETGRVEENIWKITW
ncbi:MAG: Ig-like domain-containing protein [Chitinophagaceae bacterium]